MISLSILFYIAAVISVVLGIDGINGNGGPSLLLLSLSFTLFLSMAVVLFFRRRRPLY